MALFRFPAQIHQKLILGLRHSQEYPGQQKQRYNNQQDDLALNPADHQFPEFSQRCHLAFPAPPAGEQYPSAERSRIPFPDSGHFDWFFISIAWIFTDDKRFV